MMAWCCPLPSETHVLTFAVAVEKTEHRFAVETSVGYKRRCLVELSIESEPSSCQVVGRWYLL